MSFRRVLVLVLGSVAVHLAVVACGSGDGPIFGQADRDAGAGEPDVAVEACDRVNEDGGFHYAAHSYTDLTPQQIAARVVAIGRIKEPLGYLPSDFDSVIVPISITADGVAAVTCEKGDKLSSVTFIMR